MTDPAFSLQPDDRLESLVNEVIDLESQGDHAGALDLIRKGTADCPGFGARLAATRAAVKRLRQPVFVPDHQAQVLNEVDDVRPFISPSARRQVSAYRVAIAASLVLTLSVLALLEWRYPNAMTGASTQRPIGVVVEASKADAKASLNSLASAVDLLRDGVSGPVSSILPPPEAAIAYGPRRLAFGDTSRYELGPAGRGVVAGPVLSHALLGQPRLFAHDRRPGYPAGSASGLSVGGGLLLFEHHPLTLLSPPDFNASIRPINPFFDEELRLDDDGVVNVLPIQAEPLPPKPPVQPKK